MISAEAIRFIEIDYPVIAAGEGLTAAFSRWHVAQSGLCI